MAGQKRFRSFIDTASFDKAWKQLGLNDEEHAVLEDAILIDPTRHPVIAGTDGLRKMRYAPRSWSTGKSGAIRVCYVYFPQHGTIILVTAYAKHQKDDLTAAEKHAINQAIARVERGLANFKVTRRRDP